jgi:hypothetical protein
VRDEVRLCLKEDRTGLEFFWELPEDEQENLEQTATGDWLIE